MFGVIKNLKMVVGRWSEVRVDRDRGRGVTKVCKFCSDKGIGEPIDLAARCPPTILT